MGDVTWPKESVLHLPGTVRPWLSAVEIWWQKDGMELEWTHNDWLSQREVEKVITKLPPSCWPGALENYITYFCSWQLLTQTGFSHTLSPIHGHLSFFPPVITINICTVDRSVNKIIVLLFLWSRWRSDVWTWRRGTLHRGCSLLVLGLLSVYYIGKRYILLNFVSSPPPGTCFYIFFIQKV